VQQGIDTPIRQWQEDVERTLRLLGQGGPQAEFEDLPGRAGLIACECLDVDIIHGLPVSFLP
jgi:hypothetical protein